MSPDAELLDRLDAYLDAFPRPSTRVEEIGPFTLFVNEGAGWPYYARPTRGIRTAEPRDVEVLRERQRDLGVPEQIEWVVDLAPEIGVAAEAAGLHVIEHPLMHLPIADVVPIPPPPDVEITLAAPEDDVAAITAVASIAFGSPGTAAAGALDDAATRVSPDLAAFTRDRIERGLTVTAIARIDGQLVATGAHNPLDNTTEIVGVGTLPGFRRRGIGAALTSFLVDDALARGIDTVLLSAGGDDVARIYGQLGFRRVGSAGAAEPAL